MTRYTQNSFGRNENYQPRVGTLRYSSCPRTWFVEALLVTLFCFLPLGFPAMWFSSKVERAYALGNYDEAVNYANKSRTLVMWSFTIGAMIWIVSLLLYLSGSIDVAGLFTYSL